MKKRGKKIQVVLNEKGGSIADLVAVHNLIADHRGAAFAFAPVVRGENKLTVRNEGDGPADIELIGSIGKNWWDGTGVSEEEFRAAINSIPRGKKIRLIINSEGGSVQEGLGIYNAIKDRSEDVTAEIHGYALSIASIIPLAAARVISPKSAIWMIHKAWSFAQGNADFMRQQAEMLDAHDETLAAIYVEHTGKSQDEILADMESEKWIKGSAAVEYGLADEGDDESAEASAKRATATFAYRPLHKDFLSRCKNISPEILNCIKAGAPNPPTQGANKTKNQTQEKNVNRQQMIALLAEWGITVKDGVTDARLKKLIALGQAGARAEALKLIKAGDKDMECEATEKEKEEDEGDESQAGKKVVVVDVATLARLEKLEKQALAGRETSIRDAITILASEDRIPVNQIEDWVADAVGATDDAVKGNPVVNRLKALPQAAPGVRPVSVDLGEETLSIAKLDKVVSDLLKPQKHVSNNRIQSPDNDTRRTIAARSRQIASIINRMKKVGADGMLAGPLRDAWDGWASGVQNANQMSADLLRQLIMSELMRAFRRNFASLDLFAHNYKDVALQGTDKVEVPYYPLDQVASTEFVQANGYVMGANAVTNSKEIQVGGIGNNVASPGRGRKYKPLQFSAYEINRQPWLNLAQLIVMAAEQLAIDVRGDIMAAHIKAANFGNAIWQGAAGAFDSTVVAQYLRVAASRAFWPETMRNMVLTPEFYASLAADPYVKAFLNIGDTNTIRLGKIGGLYGFRDTVEDALLPVANFIRGGDGAVTPGADLNLAGFICYPTAILIATAPIMPAPATMRLLASYEQVTDEQTGLTFSYQYFGNPLGSVDNEIIECCYGSGLGELAALKRIVTAGV